MDVSFRYVFEDVDRHGNVRVYFWRRPGKKVRIHEPLGSEAFARRYRELIDNAEPIPATENKPAPGTFGWLVNRYLHSPALAAMDDSTRRNRRQTLLSCCNEPIAPGDSVAFVGFPLERMTIKHLRILRDRKADTPGAAMNRVKALRALFSWSTAHETTSTNPARDLERPKLHSRGAVTWTMEDVKRFEDRHAVGTMARLALAILLYTGMRRSDAAQLGRQHIKDGWISKPQYKNRARKPKRIEIPLLQPLAEVIAATPSGHLTLLQTSQGNPFTIAGFGNWFRDRCREAGLDGLSAHGLRKAGATSAAERGATAHQLMAIFNWDSLSEAELYTKAAERKRMASDAMGLIVPTASNGENKRGKKSK